MQSQGRLGPVSLLLSPYTYLLIITVALPVNSLTTHPIPGF